jgi:hypothetical protein
MNAKEIKEQVSIVDLLSKLGYHPVPRGGNEIYYFSMIRDAERTPSFSVNDKLGVWFDHGIGKGGNIIDFGLAYWKNLSFEEVLEKIQRVCDQVSISNNSAAYLRTRRHAVKLPYYKIAEIKELGNNPAITDYLKERRIWNVAEGRLKEIYYYCEDEKKTRKSFFAAGWQNETGSWEVRNKYFKGCVGNKGITLITGSTPSLLVFEGYFNYLSWVSENPKLLNQTVLVLNSRSFLQMACQIAKEYKAVSLFLDRDKTGFEATILFKQAVPQAADQSLIYEDYNDYNERLMAGPKIDKPRPDIFGAAFSQ